MDTTRINEVVTELAGGGAGYAPNHRGPEGTESWAVRTGWVWVPVRTGKALEVAREAGLAVTAEELISALGARGIDL